MPLQRVAVLHLEEKCDRAIEWALKIEPSIKHLVCEKHISILIKAFNFLSTPFPFLFCSSGFSLSLSHYLSMTDKLLRLGGLWRCCIEQACEGSA